MHRETTVSAPLRDPPPLVRFTWNGRPIEARSGQSIAAALLADGVRTLRRTSPRDEPRGLFCNMGVCFDCLVEVDGRAGMRACQVVVAEGMRVRPQPSPSGPVE